MLSGWSQPEATHRWTLGRESHLNLRHAGSGPDRVLVINATPCRHPPALMGQTIMVALDGKLLTTLRFDALYVAAIYLPADTRPDAVLTFVHLHTAVPRPSAQVRDGHTLGLMLHSVRVFALGTSGILPVRNPADLVDADLVSCFESIGQGCHFGLIQRECGVEPVGLLRFVDTTTSRLYEALVARFDGIGAPGRFEWHRTDGASPTWRWQQRDFDLWFDTRIPVDEAAPDTHDAAQSRRLDFLRRKFLEDCAAAEKIFVLTRSDCLTEPEALAVYCALTLSGPCTLLWTVFGDAEKTGQVERLAPGFLRGELGEVNQVRYAPLSSWQATLRNALSK